MEFTLAGIIALVVGLSEAAKQTGLNVKFVPLLNLALGVALTFAYALIVPMGLPETVMTGIMVGLSASGAWSGAKNVAQGIKGE